MVDLKRKERHMGIVISRYSRFQYRYQKKKKWYRAIITINAMVQKRYGFEFSLLTVRVMGVGQVLLQS